MLKLKYVIKIRTFSKIMCVLNGIALLIGMFMVIGSIGCFDYAAETHIQLDEATEHATNMRILYGMIISAVTLAFMCLYLSFTHFLDAAIEYRTQKALKAKSHAQHYVGNDEQSTERQYLI
jgi:hypothetical protein